MSSLGIASPIWGREAFVVIGSTGEWSDHNEWIVAVYLDDALAAEHVAHASRRAAELHAWRSADGHAWGRLWQAEMAARPTNEWDPKMDINDETGTTYRLEPAPLRCALGQMTGCVVDEARTETRRAALQWVAEQLEAEAANAGACGHCHAEAAARMRALARRIGPDTKVVVRGSDDPV